MRNSKYLPQLENKYRFTDGSGEFDINIDWFIYEIKPWLGEKDPMAQLNRYLQWGRDNGEPCVLGTYPFDDTAKTLYPLINVHYWLEAPGVINYELKLDEDDLKKLVILPVIAAAVDSARMIAGIKTTEARAFATRGWL